MSKFPVIADLSDSSCIIAALREIGKRFYDAKIASSEKISSETWKPGEEHSGRLERPELTSKPQSVVALSDKEFQNAYEVLRPLSTYLQCEAKPDKKLELSNELATLPDVIDYLCEGILYPFVEDINVGIGISPYRRGLILVLQICLMEWSQSSVMKVKLVKCGCIFMMFKELRRCSSVLHLTSDEFSQHLIQTAALTVNNCVTMDVDLYMRLYPYTDVQGILTAFFKCPNPIVKLVCKVSYYQFSYYLHNSAPGSVDCHGDIIEYVRILRTASEDKDLLAWQEHVSLPAASVLLILRQLCVSEPNCQTLITSGEFHVAIRNFLQCGVVQELICTLELLLCVLEGNSSPLDSEVAKAKKVQIISEAKKEQLLSHNPDVVQQVEKINQDTNNEILKKLCSTLLLCLKASTEKEIESCLLCAEFCYNYGLYHLCCKIADYALERNSLPEKTAAQFQFYIGKAKFHVYQQQEIVLQRSEKLLNRSELIVKREDVYANAKSVVSILGKLKANGITDRESTKLMDYALMDYNREVNKQPEGKSRDGRRSEFFCMLCHERKPLLRSHFVPASVLKRIFRDAGQLYMSGPSGYSVELHEKTVRTMTFYLFCDKCDNTILSSDEMCFVRDVLPLVYDLSLVDTDINIAYQGWLYRFCVGMVFRGLALARGLSGSTNEDDIYQLLEACRSILLSKALPQATPKPTIAILFTPLVSQLSHDVKTSNQKHLLEQKKSSGTEPEVHNNQHSSEKIVVPEIAALEEMKSVFIGGDAKLNDFFHSLNNYCFNKLSTLPLLSSTPFVERKRFFFAVHFGVFTIIAFLEPVPHKYSKFLISEKGGELCVPSNTSRLDFNPPGLMSIYKEYVAIAEKDFIEKGLQGLKTVDEPTVPLSFNLLHLRVNVNRGNSTVSAKGGDQILLHHTWKHDVSPPAGNTFFLATEFDSMNPYAVVHSYSFSSKVLQTLGFYVSPVDFTFKAEMDKQHKDIFSEMRSEKVGIFEAPSKFFPALLTRAGLLNYQSLLYHVIRNVTFDNKCAIKGCWYCSLRCNVCFKHSQAGFTIKRESDTFNFQFCSEECKSFLGPMPEFLRLNRLADPVKMPATTVSIKLLAPDSHLPSESIKAVHLLSIHLPASSIQTPTMATFDVYKVVEGAAELKEGSLFTLFHFKTITNQVCGEFFLNDELQLSKPLPHATSRKLSEETVVLVNQLLKEGIKMSGADVQAICAHSSKEVFTDQKEVSTAEDIDITGLF